MPYVGITHQRLRARVNISVPCVLFMRLSVFLLHAMEFEISYLTATFPHTLRVIVQTIFTLAESLVGGGINQSYEVNVAHLRFKCLDDKLGKYSLFPWVIGIYLNLYSFKVVCFLPSSPFAKWINFILHEIGRNYASSLSITRTLLLFFGSNFFKS